MRTGQTDVQGEQHPLRERGTRQRSQLWRDRSDSPDGEETGPGGIDETVQLLKRHVPYHESDHVLNIAYNALLGGLRLEDIELRRNDEVFLNALGAQRIPDPTTSGDFTRRFDEVSIEALMEGINRVRQRVWKKQAKGFMEEAFIAIAQTNGKCASMGREFGPRKALHGE